MPPLEIAYLLPDGGKLTLTSEVVAKFSANRQIKAEDHEAGGQLFGKINASDVEVVFATGPRSCDSRSRFGFMPNRPVEQKEINRMFRNELHYLGDWHTHPQPVPMPSRIDVETTTDCFLKSKHQLNFFLVVVVGQLPFPEGLWVGLANGVGLFQLKPT